MAVGYDTFNWHVKTGQELVDMTAGTGVVYKAITATGTVANRSSNSIGVLQTYANSGSTATVAVSGISKIVAAEALSLGGSIAVTTSGYMRAPQAGDKPIGVIVGAAVSSGSVGTALLDFATPTVTGTVQILATFTAAEPISSGRPVCLEAGLMADNVSSATGVTVNEVSSGAIGYASTAGFCSVAFDPASLPTASGKMLTVVDGYFTQAAAGSFVVGRVSDMDLMSGNHLGIFNFATPTFVSSTNQLI